MQFTRNIHMPVIIAEASKEEIALNNNSVNRTCLCCNESKNLDKFFQNEELRTNREVVCLTCCSKLVTDVDNFSSSDFEELCEKIILNDYTPINKDHTDDVNTTRDLIREMCLYILYSSDEDKTIEDLIPDIHKNILRPKIPSRFMSRQGKLYYDFDSDRWVNVDRTRFTKYIKKGTEYTITEVLYKDIIIDPLLMDGVFYFSIRDSYILLGVSKKFFNKTINNILGDMIFELLPEKYDFISPLIYMFYIKDTDNNYQQKEYIPLSFLKEIGCRIHKWKE